jgi:glycosyltransferase involved in cell wall biosynthesis
MAGEGRDRATLVAAAKGLPVRFVSHLDDIAPNLAAADLLCLPSRAEGLPLALLEAMGRKLRLVNVGVRAIEKQAQPLRDQIQDINDNLERAASLLRSAAARE